MSSAISEQTGRRYRHRTTPWAHQEAAVGFAYNKEGTMLALDMGCGKTKTAIDLEQNWYPGKHKTLILCPKSVVSVWPVEYEKHAIIQPRIVALQHGTVKTRGARVHKELHELYPVLPHALVVVLNYEAAIYSPLKDLLVSATWDLIILDESHRIKAPGGKTSWLCHYLRPRSRRRLCLTGTPLPHSPLDAYAQYRFLDPRIFGTSFTYFRARYAVLGGYKMKQIVGWQNQGDFEANLKTIMYRVKSEDVLDLPDQIDTARTCQLHARTMRLYRQLKEEFLLELEQGIVTASNSLTRLLRLQQLTSGYTKTDNQGFREGTLVELDQAKVKLCEEVISDLPALEPVVIFCRFRVDLNNIKKIADENRWGASELSGEANTLSDWQAGKTKILAVQIQSGGVGIDLTRARYAIYYSLGFSLGDYLQSRKRLHRPGQHHHVTYIHLLAEKTIDRIVLKALEKRLDVVEAVLSFAKHNLKIMEKEEGI